MSNKRVVDDWEDDWEREASLGSSNNNNNKRQEQRNPFSRQADILQAQNNKLTELRDDLSKKLKSLKLTLFDLEQEEESLLKESNALNYTYNTSLDELITLIMHDTKRFLDDKSGYDAFIKKNNQLSDQILDILTKWKHKLKHEEEEEEEEEKETSASHKTNNSNKRKKEIDKWISAFKRTELERIDLSIQVKGYTARIQQLEKETSKLNTLPQIPSILNATTESYVQTMKEISKKQEVVERDSILPCLDSLVELKITTALYQNNIMQDYKTLESIIEDLKLAYRVSLRQRAIQQMLTYIFDYEMQSKENKLSILETMTNELEEQKEKKEKQQKEDDQDRVAVNNDDNDNNDNDNDGMMVKQSYDTILHLLDVNDLASAIRKIEDMQRKCQQSSTKWNNELQQYLSTIEVLNEIQSTLSNTVHQYSLPNDSEHNSTSSITRHYTNLQTEFEFRIQELQASILSLEKDINDPEKIKHFEEQKKLFSAFYTDANVFEQLISEKKR